MQLTKTIIAIAATLALVGASPLDAVDARGIVVARDNCQNYLGPCDQNGCEGTYSSPSDTTGTCTAGTFAGCPCEKCGSGTGYTGSCTDNGCQGVQGTCTAGAFQGCPCN